jgi:hypothetical protein
MDEWQVRVAAKLLANDPLPLFHAVVDIADVQYQFRCTSLISLAVLLVGNLGQLCIRYYQE